MQILSETECLSGGAEAWKRPAEISEDWDDGGRKWRADIS